MHVLLLTDYLKSPEDNPGGLEAVTRVLAERLNAHPDIHLTVLTCETGFREEVETAMDGVRIVRVPSPRPKVITRVVRDTPCIAGKIREISPDLVHAHLARYAHAALRTGIPTVWTVHGITLNQRQDWKGLSGRIRGMTYNFIDRSCLKRVRHIIEISPYVRQIFSPYTSARFHPVENPVEPDFFRIPGKGLKGRILTVGSIERRKGTLVLLETARILRERREDFTLHIVGGSKEDPYHEEALRYVKTHRLAPCVTFRGIRAGADLYREYEEAAICTLASREETAPVTLLEAMAAGRPVVATNVGGNPWLVREGETGFLVAPFDPETMARRIQGLLHEPERAGRMGRTAREEAEKRFRPTFIAEETIRVYNKILEDPAGRIREPVADHLHLGTRETK